MNEQEQRERREFMEAYRKLSLAQQQDFWKRKMLAPDKRFKIVRDIWLVSDPPVHDEVDAFKYSGETAIAHLPTGLWMTQKMSFDDVVTKLEQQPEHDEQLLQMMRAMDAEAAENLDDKINEILMRGKTADADFWEHYPDDIREAARLVRQKLWRNPLITDVYNRMNAHVPNTRPEHAIGHKLWAELICALIILAKDGQGTGDDEYGVIDSGEVVPNVAAVGPLMLVRIAQTYLWTELTEKLAHAAPLPKHTVSRSVLQAKTMFWAREMPHGGDGTDWVSNWMIVAEVDDNILCAHDAVSMDGKAFRVCTFEISYGATWPDDFAPENIDVVGEVLKRCAFLNSPYVTNEKRKVSRHLRRQMQRENREPPPDDDVSIVMLRRMQVRKGKQPSGEHPGVEWKHHWWVQAFYRAQWYPSEQAHRVIWIEAFLKGDMNKPLLEKIYKVVR